jgi:hypothetical protein
MPQPEPVPLVGKPLVGDREVTRRYRLPLVRPTEPTDGSTTTTVSGESGS